MRIVSLLPSTTEILFALGAGASVVGVTFECDTPAEARTRTVVSTSAMPPGLTPAEIDAHVAGALARGEDLYHLSADALRASTRRWWSPRTCARSAPSTSPPWTTRSPTSAARPRS